MPWNRSINCSRCIYPLLERHMRRDKHSRHTEFTSAGSETYRRTTSRVRSIGGCMG
ncbi:hypothetical protein B0T16DRAFT_420647 [Cercophora newfieldiana]|uniref:Uncharacterized protein n=1 Tax=Cercophora newfieldiana TaxID=92897 RepID=A0AA40CLY5_9PEZI|nr:hypothetical protein B0T16DRAFT_420647 [Cercophora newfieldiana]